MYSMYKIQRHKYIYVSSTYTVPVLMVFVNVPDLMSFVVVLDQEPSCWGLWDEKHRWQPEKKWQFKHSEPNTFLITYSDHIPINSF